MKRIFLPLFLLVTSGMAQGAALDCPEPKALRKLLDLGSLYFGEVHGTVEIPTFIRCLVAEAVRVSGRPLFVSLEMTPDARSADSVFWQGLDGRSSTAMWELVQDFVQRERRGELTLDFHRELPLAQSPEELNEYLAAMDRMVFERLVELSRKGIVIALAGNYHTRTQAVRGETQADNGFDSVPIKRLRLASVDGGAAWVCVAQSCGPHQMPASDLEGATPGALLDGALYDHDFLYFLESRRYTASPPKIQSSLSR